MDYNIIYTVDTDSGTQKTKQIDAVSNFRKLFIILNSYTLEGDMDEELFEKNMGMTTDEYVAKGDEVCDAIISFRLRDKAATLNKYTYTDKNGVEQKLYTEDNEQYIVFRFYRFSERKAYLTIEVVEEFDENGKPISDPTKAGGGFYVLTSYLDNLVEGAQRLINEERVEQD